MEEDPENVGFLPQNATEDVFIYLHLSLISSILVSSGISNLYLKIHGKYFKIKFFKYIILSLLYISLIFL